MFGAHPDLFRPPLVNLVGGDGAEVLFLRHDNLRSKSTVQQFDDTQAKRKNGVIEARPIAARGAAGAGEVLDQFIRYFTETINIQSLSAFSALKQPIE